MKEFKSRKKEERYEQFGQQVELSELGGNSSSQLVVGKSSKNTNTEGIMKEGSRNENEEKGG